MKYTVEIDKEKTIRWYIEGTDVLHREDDLPAIEWKDGSRKWVYNGKTHREGDMPAITRPHGYEAHWKNGIRHRDSGPQEITADGRMIYRRKGIEYNPFDDFKTNKTQSNNIAWGENIEYTVIVDDYVTCWYRENNGELELHREGDMPAKEWGDGSKAWFLNGVPDRIKHQPHYEELNGFAAYWDEDTHFHREEGLPAVIRQDGSSEYWIHGEQYCPEDNLEVVENVIECKPPQTITIDDVKYNLLKI